MRSFDDIAESDNRAESDDSRKCRHDVLPPENPNPASPSETSGTALPPQDGEEMKNRLKSLAEELVQTEERERRRLAA